MAGANGAAYIQKFDTEKFSVKFACEVKDFDPLSFLDKKEARRMGAFTHFALAASDEAMKHSGLVIDASNADRVGTYISSGIGDFWAIEREHEKLLNSGPDRVSPFFIVSAIVNLAAGSVSIRHGAQSTARGFSAPSPAGTPPCGTRRRAPFRGTRSPRPPAARARRAPA